MSIVLGMLRDGRTLATLIAVPADASDRPLSVYAWSTPPSLQGTVNLSLNATAGNVSPGIRSNCLLTCSRA